MPDRNDAIAGDIPIEVEKCPLCIETGIAAMSEDILAASQTVGPPLTAEEFLKWLKSEYSTTQD